MFFLASSAYDALLLAFTSLRFGPFSLAFLIADLLLLLASDNASFAPSPA
jgi:hypothetical protein